MRFWAQGFPAFIQVGVLSPRGQSWLIGQSLSLGQKGAEVACSLLAAFGVMSPTVWPYRVSRVLVRAQQACPGLCAGDTEKDIGA